MHRRCWAVVTLLDKPIVEEQVDALVTPEPDVSEVDRCRDHAAEAQATYARSDFPRRFFVEVRQWLAIEPDLDLARQLSVV